MIVSTGINKVFGKDTSSIFLSPKRISVTVSAMTAKKLWKRSSEEGRSLSNLVAYILEEATEGNSQD